MLRTAKRPVTRMELVKWAFLLRFESSSRGGSSFYDFLPFHYGPYSFGLSREIESLADSGYVQAVGQTWELDKTALTPQPTINAAHYDAALIVKRFLKYSVNDLVAYVYERYPAFTVYSKRQKLAIRTLAKPTVFTAGYEGLQVDGFLNLLVQQGITRLIDVRSNPIARRFGFHKSTLDRLCGKLGISYEHVPELGIPSELRRHLESNEDYELLFESYRTGTLTTQTESILKVASWVKESASVLVCMEANASCCHRSRLANVISEMTDLSIVHLQADR